MVENTYTKIWQRHIAHHFNVAVDSITIDGDDGSNEFRFSVGGCDYYFDAGHDDYEQYVFVKTPNGDMHAFVISPTRDERGEIDEYNQECQ